ncbi:hypothetical protein TELCIR_17330, partial [Teladorsagia circumcincta]
VTTFWPEFGKNGKGNITIRDVLDHRAGLITFGREFGLEEAKNSNVIAELIETATPLWTPGSHRGYHAFTYGFVVDRIIRRLHPKGYDVPTIYKEEIWEEGRTLVCNLSKDPIPYNDPAVRELSLTSCMGIGTALGFAQAIQQVFKKNMIPDSIRKIISEPTATEEDIVLAEEKSFGHGFIYARHP